MPLPDPYPSQSAAHRDSGIAALIDKLADADVPVRASAASSIFARGRERAMAATREWFRDAEVADCFIFDHLDFPQTTVGIAVQPASFERIRAANSMPRLADVPSDLDALEFELHIAEATALDILTTRDTEGDGAIARFLRRQGEGIQQVELGVRSVDRAMAVLDKQCGAAPIYAAARRGADGTRVNFFLVAAGDGQKLLIALVEASGSAE
jgi:hypothetical protein